VKIAREDYGKVGIWIKDTENGILAILRWDGFAFIGSNDTTGFTHSAKVRLESKTLVEIAIPRQRVQRGGTFWITEDEFVLEMDKLSDVFMTPLVPTDGKPEDVTALGDELERMRLP
jgi:hypothetical protein